MGTYVEGLYWDELYHFSILISFCMYICLFGAKFFFSRNFVKGDGIACVWREVGKSTCLTVCISYIEN